MTLRYIVAAGFLAASMARASAPAWWTEQSVISSQATADDFAVANVGQLKFIAQRAALQMESSLPGGAGAPILGMISAWEAGPGPGVVRDDFATLNIGQLKAVAKPYYDRLYALGYAGRPLESGRRYPWSGAADDYALVNLGQLKYVFSYLIVRLGPVAPSITDTDGDGLADSDEALLGLLANNPDQDGDGVSDGWEVFFGFNATQASDATSESDGDHLSALMEFLLGRRPDLDEQDVSPKLAAGGGQSLHTLASGFIQAWGDNRFGQIGAAGGGAVVARRVTLPAPANVVEVATGYTHSLALTKSGQVYAWGGNEFGQLGTGDRDSRPAPVLVPGLSGIVQLAIGDDHSLALDGQGRVWAWGANHKGQSAANSASYVHTPQLVAGLARIAQISAGARFSMALNAAGELFAWGDNSFGQLASTTLGTSSVPVPISLSGVKVRRVASGRGHVLALDTHGGIWAWGANFVGQLGSGSSTGSASPVLLANVSGAKAVAAGDLHSLAISETKTLLAWGANRSGQLGLGGGDVSDRTAPVSVPALTNVHRVAAGRTHSVAMSTDASLVIWGDNTDGRLGTGSSAPLVPVPSPVLPPE